MQGIEEWKDFRDRCLSGWEGRRAWLQYLLLCFNVTMEGVEKIHKELEYKSPEQWQDQALLRWAGEVLGKLDRDTAKQLAQQIALADWVEREAVGRLKTEQRKTGKSRAGKYLMLGIGIGALVGSLSTIAFAFLR